MNNYELEYIINKKLDSNSFSDYCPNGLQIQGCDEVKNIIVGVTACQALLEEAVLRNADAIIVHHGYFWKNEPPVIKGMKSCRIRAIMQHDINLYSWHLPLDIHPTLGNNAKLAELLGITFCGKISPLVCWGRLPQPMKLEELSYLIEQKLCRPPLYLGNNDSNYIDKLAWCSGGGQEFIDMVAQFGVDAYITGEASEQTFHSAVEQKVHFYSAGHHATERGGIRAIGTWLEEKHNLQVQFIDILNPI
jgi:dinuclear metal center YbgI/SA1388 family protein